MTPHATEAPHELEAERAVLAAMMLDRATVARARSILSADAFYRVPHQAMARAIFALDDRGETADLVALGAELRARGELEAAGGVAALAAILDFATTTANLEHHARLIRAAHAKRRAIKLMREGSETVGNGSGGVTLSDLIGGYGVRLAEIARDSEPGPRAPTLEEQVADGAALFDHATPTPKDLIGSGYLVAGGFSLMASPPGFGKTYLALQAMRAGATGDGWLGYQCGRFRSLMVQLEMPEHAIRERIGRDRQALEGAADWLIMPEGFGSLETSATLDQMTLIVEKRQIGLLILDPLNQCHGGNLNFDDEIAPFLAAVKKLRIRTGVHVLVLHHLNKIEFDKHDSLRSNALRAIKGSGRLTGDPDTVIVLLERHGRLHLVNAKTRLGPSVESMAIRQGEDGWFTEGDTPEEVAMGNESKVESCLRFHGARGATMEELVAETGMSRGTVIRHLGGLDVRKAGGGRGRGLASRWYLAEFSPQEEAGIEDSQTIDDGDSHPF